MEKLVILLAFFCWHTAQSQAPVWGLQISTFPVFPAPEENALFSATPATVSDNMPETPHCIEPGLVLSWENQRTFHNVVFNPLSRNFTNLNIFIGEKLDYYCFFSYTPQDRFWFSAFGVSKSFEVSKSAWVTPYAEWGCDSFNPKSWLIEVGIVYGLDLGQIKFKNKKTKKPKGIDCS